MLNRAHRTVTVVTPWLRHEELAPAYFAAIAAGTPDELIVVDNGSNPALEFAHVRFQRNRGFQRACNYGLRAASSEAVVFLNNDVEMTDPAWLDRIRAELRPGALVGAALRADEHTAVDGTVVAYLEGWCVAGMRDDLLAIGGWDESLAEPSYFGDNLLSLRARQAGLELVEVAPGLRHLGGMTSSMFPRWYATEANQGIYEQAVRDARTATAGIAGHAWNLDEIGAFLG